MLRILLVASVCLLGTARATWAQESTPIFQPQGCAYEYPLPQICSEDLKQWKEAEAKWRNWITKYGNFAVYDHRIIKPVHRPEPPAWTVSRCTNGSQEKMVDETCVFYDESKKYDWLQHYVGPKPVYTYTRKSSVRMAERMGFKEWLLQNLHYDTFWTNSNNDARSYGFLGSHITIGYMGRFGVWAAPGIIVLYENSR